MDTQREQTFTDAYRSYAATITSHTYYRTNDPDIAQDIVQEAFFKTWRYLHEDASRSIDDYKRFLYTVAHRLIIEHYRRKARSPLPLDAMAPEQLIDPKHEDLEQRTIRKVLLERRLARLPERYRLILEYRLFEHMEIDEIGKTLGISPNHVNVIIYRAKKKLTDALNRQERPEGHSPSGRPSSRTV